MKKLTPALLLLSLASCALFNKSGPAEDKVAATEKTFATTVSALTQLRAQGRISNGDWTRIKEVAESVNSAFISLHADIDAGKTVDTDAVLRGINQSITELAAQESKARALQKSGARLKTAQRPEAPYGSRVRATAALAGGFGRNAGQGQVHARAA